MLTFILFNYMFSTIIYDLNGVGTRTPVTANHNCQMITNAKGLHIWLCISYYNIYVHMRCFNLKLINRHVPAFAYVN